MPFSIAPIFTGTTITDKMGRITDFFRFRWEEVRSLASVVPTVFGEPMPTTFLAQTAAIVTTTLYTTQTGAQFTVNYALNRSVNDGVASSLTVTISWTQRGTPKSFVAAALTEADGLSEQSLAKPIYADGSTPITIAVAYSSNTPNKATYDLHASVEQKA